MMMRRLHVAAHQRDVILALDGVVLVVLVAAEEPQGRAKLQELLAEGVVESAVQERVAARRRHGDQVTRGERRVVVFPASEVDQLEVGDQVDQIDGKPHGAEKDNHGDEHSVGLAHSLKS